MKSNWLVVILVALILLVAGMLAWVIANIDDRAAETLTQELERMVGRREQPIELPPITRAPHTITLEDGSEVTYTIAEPFDITVAAEGLGKARFMAMSPDNRLFVPDLVDYELSHEGKLYILEDFNEETGQFETQHTYLENLRGPNSVAFYTDENGRHWLYLALTAHLVRYPYEPGDTEPSGEPEVIVEFPNTQAPEANSVVWHITRTIEFHNGRAYVSVGSGCDACEQPEGELRGMIFSMNPDGSDIEVYAEGLRNSVGLTWADDTLFATENGVDQLGPDAPDEVMYQIEEGEHYGWPYCYESGGEVLLYTYVEWERAISCDEVPYSFASFAPRSAPLGVTYFDDAHPMLEGTFLVALHGSFEAWMQNGYQIVRVTKDGEQEVFMDGFQSADGERYGRPVDFLQYDENSFFFTDDHAGRIYYLSTS